MDGTLPGLLVDHAERNPRGIALRQKRLGIWHEVTWDAYLDGVQTISLGLTGLGLEPGEVVALAGESRVQWLEAELGIQAAAGIAAPLFARAAASELANLLNASGARFAIVEGQEQVDKLLSLRDRIPSLKRVIYWDGRGMRAYSDPLLLPLWEITGDRPPEGPQAASPSGSRTRSTDNDAHYRFMSMVTALRPEAVAEIVSTPGTQGTPKAVRLSHANLIAAARALVDAEQLDRSSEFVSFAPNAWIGDRVFALAASLLAGYPVNLPEEPDTVPQDIREIGPRLLVAPPVVWQRLAADTMARAEGTGRLRRAMCRALLVVAEQAASLREAGETVPVGTWLQALLANLLICRPLRDHLGLLRVRNAYSAGAPLAEETEAFFRSIGVPLKQLYLITAAAGPVSVGQQNAGRALPGVQLQLCAQGEVLARGPGVAAPDAGEGSSVLARDGWLATGDLGRIEPNGTLTLLGRVTGVARLADGTQVLPGEIERRLSASPYLRHAVVLADGQPYVTALIAIDGPAVSAWVERRGIAVTTHRELSQHPRVHELVQEAVQTANARLRPSLQVQRFAILDRELSFDDGELTFLGTVRRAAVTGHWPALMATLCGFGLAPDAGPRVIAVEQAATSP